MSSYCKRCEGSGSVPTGIAEAPESSCRACGGTGYAPTQGADPFFDVQAATFLPDGTVSVHGDGPMQGADARPVAIDEILNRWSIEHQVFLPQDFWEDLEKRLKGVS